MCLGERGDEPRSIKKGSRFFVAPQAKKNRDSVWKGKHQRPGVFGRRKGGFTNERTSYSKHEQELSQRQKMEWWLLQVKDESDKNPSIRRVRKKKKAKQGWKTFHKGAFQISIRSTGRPSSNNLRGRETQYCVAYPGEGSPEVWKDVYA